MHMCVYIYIYIYMYICTYDLVALGRSAGGQGLREEGRMHGEPSDEHRYIYMYMYVYIYIYIDTHI